MSAYSFLPTGGASGAALVSGADGAAGAGADSVTALGALVVVGSCDRLLRRREVESPDELAVT